MHRVPEILRLSFRDIPSQEWQKHGLLFALTAFSTFLTGLEMSFYEGWTKIFMALSYSIPVMIILTGHEMGHYIVARVNGVKTSLPYFIPLPVLSPFGTMGAFIKMHQLPASKTTLFDIAFWGPAISFLFSVPFAIAGVALSEVHPISQEYSGLIFGESLILKFFISIFHTIPSGHELYLHPMAFAAWVGFFVTAINLFPIGQLDGGHIAYAILGKHQKKLAIVFLTILIFLAIQNYGWILWILLLYYIGIVHPPMATDQNEVRDPKRIRYGIFSFLILILCFIPFPLEYGNDSSNANEEITIPEASDKYNVLNDTNRIRKEYSQCRLST